MKEQGVVPFTTAYKQRDPIDSIQSAGRAMLNNQPY